MKILHTEASAGWGGQELRILAEMQGLRERGHTLELAAPASARIHREAASLGFTVHDLPIARKNLRGVLALRSLLRSRDFDVVNTHSSTDSWLAALANALSPRAVPIVRTRHISAPVPRNPATRWLYNRAAAAIVTTGEKLREELREGNGFRDVTIRSVPTGIDPERFHPADAAAARVELRLPQLFTVGIVATLRSWKGHRYLIDAVGRLRAQGHALQLLIVGDGPQREALEAQVAAAGWSGLVRFVGHDPRPERWMRAMDLFVLPSYANEGVPQALMQAMMSGLPCITTSVGAIGEVARDGETALVVRTQDTQAIADAIARLLQDADLRQQLGHAARAFALAHCTMAAMCDAMEEVFSSVRGQPR
jgi:glycosyltransferase involved in cell wall biosynthesis